MTDTSSTDVEVEDVPADPHALDAAHAELLERFVAALGDGVIETAAVFGMPTVRVRRDVWRQVAEIAKGRLDCDYLSFISGIDWRPAPREGDEAGGDTSAPVQPQEETYGATGSEGRFQVFACVQSTGHKRGIIVKVDVDEQAMLLESWVPVYPGADWHERECWEMYGVVFDGHPALRHLYLPSEFEGHPLRKDFPLLSRVVKPWPGLVDVEPMPGEDAPDEDAPEEAAPAAEAAEPTEGGDA